MVFFSTMKICILVCLRPHINISDFYTIKYYNIIHHSCPFCFAVRGHPTARILCLNAASDGIRMLNPIFFLLNLSVFCYSTFAAAAATALKLVARLFRPHIIIIEIFYSSPLVLFYYYIII